MQEYEISRGRKTVRRVNEPRSLDLDLLYAGRNWIKNPRLNLPHPRMAERRFVIEPLAELSPGLRIAGLPEQFWRSPLGFVVKGVRYVVGSFEFRQVA